MKYFITNSAYVPTTCLAYQLTQQSLVGRPPGGLWHSNTVRTCPDSPHVRKAPHYNTTIFSTMTGHVWNYKHAFMEGNQVDLCTWHQIFRCVGCHGWQRKVQNIFRGRAESILEICIVHWVCPLFAAWLMRPLFAAWLMRTDKLLNILYHRGHRELPALEGWKETGSRQCFCPTGPWPLEVLDDSHREIRVNACILCAFCALCQLCRSCFWCTNNDVLTSMLMHFLFAFSGSGKPGWQSAGPVCRVQRFELLGAAGQSRAETCWMEWFWLPVDFMWILCGL